MVQELHVEGFDACMEAVEKHKNKHLFVLFSGSLSPVGQSWCPDCVVAEPVIQDCLQHAPPDSVFVHCGVGDRTFWKDQSNVFRTDSRLRVKSVPTLLRWGKAQRLEEGQCSNKDLVQMLFEED